MLMIKKSYCHKVLKEIKMSARATQETRSHTRLTRFLHLAVRTIIIIAKFTFCNKIDSKLFLLIHDRNAKCIVLQVNIFNEHTGMW